MAAQFVAFGKTIVTEAGGGGAGIPVRIRYPSDLRPPNVHALIIEALSTNTGKIYIGLAGLNRSTLEQVLVVLPIPTVNLLPTFSIAVTIAANGVNVGDLWIDVDNVEDGVLVSALVA